MLITANISRTCQGENTWDMPLLRQSSDKQHSDQARPPAVMRQSRCCDVAAVLL